MVIVADERAAALSRPASTVLFVCKSQGWAAGGIRYYLNGSESDSGSANMPGD